MSSRIRAAVGFRAKTGRAIAVAIAENQSFLWRREINLVDPKLPETFQPYHAVMELPWPEAQTAAARYVRAIELVAASALKSMLRELDIQCVGVVGSLDRNLDKIGNPHIRAHGAEGMLFRHVLEAAAATLRIRSQTFSEGDVKKARFAARLKALGTEAGPPWRADEKAAAAAALLVLS